MSKFQPVKDLQTQLDKARMELADAHVRIRELELPLPRKLFVVWAGDPTDKTTDNGVEYMAGIYSIQKRASAVRKMINESDAPFLAHVEEIEIDQAPVLPAEPQEGEVDWFGDKQGDANGKDSSTGSE